MPRVISLISSTWLSLITPGNHFFTWLPGHHTTLPLILLTILSSPLLALLFWQLNFVVPQGSVFESFVFIYTHSFVDCIQSCAFTYHLFSNNLQCLSPDKTSALNSRLACSSTYLYLHLDVHWHLKLNMFKTQSPMFRHKSAPPIVFVVAQAKCLGVIWTPVIFS